MLRGYSASLFTAILCVCFLTLLCSEKLIAQTYLINESFEGSAPPSGWTYNSITHSTTFAYEGTRSALLNANGDYIITPLLTYPGTISFWLYRVPSGGTFSVTVQWHTNPSASTWNTITTLSGTSGSWVQYSVDVPSDPAFTTKNNIYIRIQRPSSNKNAHIDLFRVTAAPPTPDFSANPLNQLINTPITFTHNSTGIVDTWLWDFGAGATPATATTPGPHQVSYSTLGSKTVSLTLNGTETVTKVDYIKITNQGSVSATYQSGDLPTDYGFQSLPGVSTCPGVLSVNIPPGATITSVDVEYKMTARNWGYMSEQRSWLRCTSPGGNGETAIVQGAGNTSGTFIYSRTGLTIANGVVGGGTITFELHAGRTWGGYGCNTTYNYVVDGSWSVTVHFHTGTIPNFSANNTAPSIGQQITFTDASGGTVTSWNWDFGQDAVPATANTQGPHQVVYTSTGPKTVSLTINGNLTETKTNYILVDDWLHWDDGTNNSAVGRTTGGVLQLATRFLPGDLSGFQNHAITHIRIYIRDIPTYALVKVWQGTSQLTLAEVVSQAFAPVANTWNTITLNQPWLVDPNLELWFGAELLDAGSLYYPGGVDAVTDKDGQSNLVRIIVSDPNAWAPLTYYGIQGDWNVQAFLVPAYNVWTGALSTDWHNAGNWSSGIIPGATAQVIVPVTVNQPEIAALAEIETLRINDGAVVTIQPNGSLTVAGTIDNLHGANGLIINTNNNLSGSILHFNAGVSGTYRRYVKGAPEAWHTFSAPVTGQTIGGVFTPTGGSGAYGDGTRYDLYVWHEPDTSWVYHLNTLLYPTWAQIHPNSSFSPGKGYLASYLDPNPTLPFVGELTQGALSIPLTKSGTTAAEFGYVLVGNPYPSSIDWKASQGWGRADLEQNAGGYDLWIWNDTAYNYGVYNSASPIDQGTLGVSRYIPPAQGFFVRAAQTGTLSMNNDVRNHQVAANWLKKEKFSGVFRVSVSTGKQTGSDEVLLIFNDTIQQQGSLKRFTMEPGAPSLYLPSGQNSFSIRRLSNPTAHPVIPVGFKCGKEGSHLLSVDFQAEDYDTVILIDLKAGVYQDLKSNPWYSFTASPKDDPGRFVVQFVSGCFPNPHNPLPASLYTFEQSLFVDLRLLPETNTYNVLLFSLDGKLVTSLHLRGGCLRNIPMPNLCGIYLGKIQGIEGTTSNKLAF